MKNMKNIDKFKGCLIGGAAGDALGYAVEFDTLQEIFHRYGPQGITEYDPENGKAIISDDTQMTLFTAVGLLCATTKRKEREILAPYPGYILTAYQDWLKTQFQKGTPQISWLNNVPALNHPRAPGNTCMSALMSGRGGSIEEPLNFSKGCGGVMRVAPIGLYFHNTQYTTDEIDMIGAEAAALTHGHPLGYIPAAMLVHIVHCLAYTDATVIEAVEDAKKAIQRLFSDTAFHKTMLALTDRAIELAADPQISDTDTIAELGEGWVGDEALAIAIYCALKYENNFEQAIIASVNHSGDSDSTGAVTGNILGARLGYQAIPEKFLTDLELKEVILTVAEDLFYDVPDNPDPVWQEKYVYHTYSPDEN